MKPLKNLFFVILAVMLVTVASCHNGSQPTAAETDGAAEVQARPDRVTLSDRQIETAGIETASLARETMAELVKANGLIQLPPNDRAAINAPFESFIQTIGYMEGARVRKGDILVSLQHPNFIQLQQQYQQAASQYAFLKKEIERQKILSDSLVTAKKQFQQTKADFESARSQTTALAEQLKMIGVDPDNVAAGDIQTTVYLRSPLSGVVARVNGFRGQSVSPQQPIMEVLDNGHLYLELNVFEKNIGKVRPGQPIAFRVTSFDESPTYTGKVSAVGGALDLTSRTVTVVGRFAPRPALIPGLYVEAEISARPKPAWVLPEEAVVLDQNASYVFVRDTSADSARGDSGKVFVKTPVKIGRTSQGRVEVLTASTLGPNAKIVVQGANYLKSEMSKGQGDDD